MKTLTTILTAIVSLSLSAFTLARETNLNDDNVGHERACAPSVIRIGHTYVDYNSDVAYRISGFSLGTVIAPSIILTHNHFHKVPESLPNETLTFFDAAGANVPLPDAGVPFVSVDKGTTLIYLPATASLPTTPLSDRVSLEHLAAGDRLTVCYWDDAQSRFTAQDFEIIQMTDDVATLADPGRLINAGDSGGGAFLDGRIVGNIWSIDVDSDGNPLGAFNVAVLPAEVQGMLEITEPTPGGAAQ